MGRLVRLGVLLPLLRLLVVRRLLRRGLRMRLLRVRRRGLLLLPLPPRLLVLLRLLRQRVLGLRRRLGVRLALLALLGRLLRCVLRHVLGHVLLAEGQLGRRLTLLMVLLLLLLLLLLLRRRVLVLRAVALQLLRVLRRDEAVLRVHAAQEGLRVVVRVQVRRRDLLPVHEARHEHGLPVLQHTARASAGTLSQQVSLLGRQHPLPVCR